ncbi:hypothetical protein QBC40DRAFT_291518 [Triangularia verruculosa]|uniref:Uncharacterized protein n=1 Tax=Triangularia verruculosa TaxID=2587418 RepID=A0AAN6X8G2_9PEZI|nr:hypothetical protein QBC40DRAFT_291518 [Triangularia verruculosa]
MGPRYLKRTKWRWKGTSNWEAVTPGWLNHSGATLPVGTDLGGSSGGVARLSKPCDPVLLRYSKSDSEYRRIQHPRRENENDC